MKLKNQMSKYPVSSSLIISLTGFLFITFIFSVFLHIEIHSFSERHFDKESFFYVIAFIAAITLILFTAVIVYLKISHNKIMGKIKTDFNKITLEKQILEEKAQQYLDIANVIIVALDEKFNVTLINKKGCEVLEYNNEKEIIGRNWFDIFIPKEERSHVEETVLKILKGNVYLVENFEHLVLCRSGKEKVISWHNSSIKNDEGHIIGILSSGEDITEKYNQEIKIFEQNAFLNDIIESLPYPFYVVNINDYSIKLANSYACKAGLWVGATCFNLTHHRESPCSGYEHVCPLKEVLKTKKAVTTEHLHFDMDGKEHIYEVHGYPIFNKSGEVIQLIEYSIDITEKKKMLNEKQKLETQLRQSQKMEAMGTLAAGIAHDFNNVLTPIIGFTELSIRSLPEDSKIRNNLSKVYQASHRAKELVQQILTFSRKNAAERMPVKVYLILKESLQLLRASIPSTIEIIKNIDTTCKPIMGDPTQIHQIVLNLCTNAYHAMLEEGGKLTIALKQLSFNSETFLDNKIFAIGEYNLLEISDTGCGIEKSIIDKIFEPYFTTKPQGEGTGLGLSVVHGIVTDMGGHIALESIPGSGTTFRLYFPCINSKADGEKIRLNDDLPGGKESIIIVDDELFITVFLRQMLEKLGYTVYAFNSSEEALERFIINPLEYNLIIADQTMPNLGGIEFIKRCLEKRSDIPVIIMTGFSEMLTGINLEEYKINHLLLKPVNMRIWAETIRNVLDTKEMNK